MDFYILGFRREFFRYGIDRRFPENCAMIKPCLHEVGIMHLLGSNWLRRMAEKSGATPQARLVGLVDTLHDWLQAPGIGETVRQQFPGQDAAELAAFRTLVLDLVTPLQPRNPHELANQIMFLLLGAMQQQLRAPESCALQHARNAVHLLIEASTVRVYSISNRPHRAALALAACLCLVLAGGLIMPWRNAPGALPPLAASIAKAKSTQAGSYSPDQLVALYQQREQQARGNCFYPMALMMPPEQYGVYLDFVWRTPALGADLDEKSLVALRHALEMVECSYPQTAMISS